MKNQLQCLCGHAAVMNPGTVATSSHHKAKQQLHEHQPPDLPDPVLQIQALQSVHPCTAADGLNT